MGLPRWHSGKEFTWQCRSHRDMGSIPGSGRSSGGKNGNSLQYSCLGNPKDRGERDFPDGPVVKNLPAKAGAWVQSPIQEDRPQSY